jgi:hypothetical protein
VAEVPFSLECQRVLFRYNSHTEAPSRLMFCTRNGTGLGKRNAGRDMAILGRKLSITGVRFSPHTMRHTFAVTFFRNGGDLYVLPRILGHANITLPPNIFVRWESMLCRKLIRSSHRWYRINVQGCDGPSREDTRTNSTTLHSGSVRSRNSTSIGRGSGTITGSAT